MTVKTTMTTTRLEQQNEEIHEKKMTRSIDRNVVHWLSKWLCVECAALENSHTHTHSEILAPSLSVKFLRFGMVCQQMIITLTAINPAIRHNRAKLSATAATTMASPGNEEKTKNASI